MYTVRKDTCICGCVLRTCSSVLKFPKGLIMHNCNMHSNGHARYFEKKLHWASIHPCDFKLFLCSAARTDKLREVINNFLEGM